MELKGCFVAHVTPFNENGEINEEGLRSNINFLIDRGVAGVVPCGTTGESATLSWDEHNRVVDIALDEAKGRVKVIAGAGSNNTSEAVAAAKHAEKMGADAILCITPYYNKPTQEGLYRHFKAVSESVDTPIVLYNVPSRTAVNLLPETVERLCDIDTIVAVKEASGDLVQVSEIHRRCGNRIQILSGDDALTLPMLTLGASGVVSVSANIIPDRMTAMLNAFFEKNMDKALEIHEEMLAVANTMFIETNPIVIKAAMNHLGLAAGGMRMPLVDITESNKKVLIDVLEKSGVKPVSVGA